MGDYTWREKEHKEREENMHGQITHVNEYYFPNLAIQTALTDFGN